MLTERYATGTQLIYFLIRISTEFLALLVCYAASDCRQQAAPKRRQTTRNITLRNNSEELGTHLPAVQAWNLARTSTAHGTPGSVNLTYSSYATWLGKLSKQHAVKSVPSELENLVKHYNSVHISGLCGLRIDITITPSIITLHV